MTPKKRDSIAGQVNATCIVVGEVRRELLQAEAPIEVNAAAIEAQNALRKLLRAVGFVGE